MRIEMHQSERRVTDQSARRTPSRAAVIRPSRAFSIVSIGGGVAWWQGVWLANKRSWVRFPDRTRLRNDPGQVVHTRMLLHQTVWIGTGQRAVTSCGWEGNRGPGEEYWQPPPGARLCRPYIQLTYSIIRGLKTNRSLPPAPTALRDPSITSITSINLP